MMWVCIYSEKFVKIIISAFKSDDLPTFKIIFIG